LRQAIRQVQATEGLAPKPNSFLNLASVLTYTGRCDEATEIATQAGTIAKAQGDAKRGATAQLLRAAALACQGKIPEAAASYESTIEMVGKTGTDERVAWALGGLAELRSLGGEIATALDNADRSVAVHRATKQMLNVAYALVGRARIRRFAGDPEGATSDIAEAKTSGGGADLPPDLVARIALDSGIAALETGDLASAERDFRSATSAPTAIDLSGFARAGLAETLCSAGRPQDGLAEARAAASPPSTFAERLEAGHALATCLLAAGRKEDAEGTARRSLGLARAAGARWPIVLATVDLTNAAPQGSAGAIPPGRRALDELIASAPGRETGNFAHRAVVRDARKSLGPS
jgi:tetratricopeptide (TPR) repeat protein